MLTKTDHLSGGKENNIKFNGVGIFQIILSDQSAMKVESINEIKKPFHQKFKTLSTPE